MTPEANQPVSLFRETFKGAAIGAGIGLAIEAGRTLNASLDRLDRIATATEKMAGREPEENAIISATIAESIPIINHGFASIRKRAMSRGLFMWLHDRRTDFDKDEPGQFMDGIVSLLSEISGWRTSLRRWNGALLEIEATLAMLDGQLNPLAAYERARRPEPPWRQGRWDNPIDQWAGSTYLLCAQAKQWNSSAVWRLFESLWKDNTLLLEQLAPSLFLVPRALYWYDRFSDGALIAARSAAETCRTAVIASGQETAEGNLDIGRIPLLAGGPGRFRVTGIRKQTAAEIGIVLRASAPEVVPLIADALGIAVASISVMEPTEAADRPLDENERESIDQVSGEFDRLMGKGAEEITKALDTFKPDFLI